MTTEQYKPSLKILKIFRKKDLKANTLSKTTTKTEKAKSSYQDLSVTGTNTYGAA